jgi:hypothetical protein
MPDNASSQTLTGRHAMYVGWVAGIGLRNGVRLVPTVDDVGNYTDHLQLTIGGGQVVTVVVPEPPDDWFVWPLKVNDAPAIRRPIQDRPQA